MIPPIDGRPSAPSRPSRAPAPYAAPLGPMGRGMTRSVAQQDLAGLADRTTRRPQRGLQRTVRVDMQDVIGNALLGLADRPPSRPHRGLQRSYARIDLHDVLEDVRRTFVAVPRQPPCPEPPTYAALPSCRVPPELLREAQCNILFLCADDVEDLVAVRRRDGLVWHFYSDAALRTYWATEFRPGPSAQGRTMQYDDPADRQPVAPGDLVRVERGAANPDAEAGAAQKMDA
jgi:hypothetical protein